MTPQQKSARTRTARQNFLKRYGETTYQVVSNLVTGREASHEVPWEVSDESIAAIHANFTRGTYKTYTRNCNF